MYTNNLTEIEELIALFRAEDEEIAEARAWYAEHGGREFGAHSYSADAKCDKISAYYREEYSLYDDDVFNKAWAIYRYGKEV